MDIKNDARQQAVRCEKERGESKRLMWRENEATGLSDHRRGGNKKEEAEDKKKSSENA